LRLQPLARIALELQSLLHRLQLAQSRHGAGRRAKMATPAATAHPVDPLDAFMEALEAPPSLPTDGGGAAAALGRGVAARERATTRRRRLAAATVLAAAACDHNGDATALAARHRLPLAQFAAVAAGPRVAAAAAGSGTFAERLGDAMMAAEDVGGGAGRAHSTDSDDDSDDDDDCGDDVAGRRRRQAVLRFVAARSPFDGSAACRGVDDDAVWDEVAVGWLDAAPAAARGGALVETESSRRYFDAPDGDADACDGGGGMATVAAAAPAADDDDDPMR